MVPWYLQMSPCSVRAVQRVLSRRAPDLDAVCASYAGVQAHPVVLKSRLWPAIFALEGDQGAKAVLSTAAVRDVDCDDVGSPRTWTRSRTSPRWRGSSTADQAHSPVRLDVAASLTWCLSSSQQRSRMICSSASSGSACSEQVSRRSVSCSENRHVRRAPSAVRRMQLNAAERLRDDHEADPALAVHEPVGAGGGVFLSGLLDQRIIMGSSLRDRRSAPRRGSSCGRRRAA